SGSAKCDATIAKKAAAFLKTKLKTLGKCMAQQVPGVCPSAKDVEKIQKAALKTRDAITKDCATDSVQTGLTSAYKNLTDDTAISSCMLSQHNATADILLGIVNGTPGQVNTYDDRAKCVKTLNNEGTKYVNSVVQAINKCIAGQTKDGVTANLQDVCVG